MAYIYINNATEKGYKFANVEVEKNQFIVSRQILYPKIMPSQSDQTDQNLCPFPDQTSSKAIPCRLHIHI